MVIKDGNVLSTPQDMPGGAPQGTKLGNFLFCVTVERILDGLTQHDEASIGAQLPEPDKSAPEHLQPQLAVPTEYRTSTPSVRGQFSWFRPPGNLESLDGSFDSDVGCHEFTQKV